MTKGDLVTTIYEHRYATHTEITVRDHVHNTQITVKHCEDGVVELSTADTPEECVVVLSRETVNALTIALGKGHDSKQLKEKKAREGNK